MRALLPASDGQPGELDDSALHEFYARDWVEPGGLRLDFVTSADGAVSTEGASAGLQTPGDNRVFAALRDLADVVVVGAGTVRMEGYGKVQVSPRRADVRRRYGLGDEVPLVVVSRSLRLDPTAQAFADAPGPRTILITCSAADAEARTALAAHADVVVCGEDTVDLAAARAALEERGLTRILCEGGPTLFADLGRAGVVDELCLSVTPLLAGPGAGRIVAGRAWADGTRNLELVGLLEEDGALFCRYRVLA